MVITGLVRGEQLRGANPSCVASCKPTLTAFKLRVDEWHRWSGVHMYDLYMRSTTGRLAAQLYSRGYHNVARDVTVMEFLHH